ncbi:MAG: putative T7SS-secreted protein [Streptosporangiaceae bacterium]
MSGEVVVPLPAGDPAALESWARQLNDCADAFDSLVSETKKVTINAADRAEWTGPASDSYRQFCTGVVQSAGRVPTSLREIGSAVGTYAQTLAAAQQQVRSAVQQANSTPAAGRQAALDSALQVSAAAGKQVKADARTAAAKVDSAKSGLSGLWDHTEPGRKLIEFILAPFDTVAADHWIDLLKEMAGQPSEWLSELGKEYDGIESLIAGGASYVARRDALIELAGKTERIGGLLDAWNAYAPGWLKAAAGSIAEIRGLSNVLTGLGLVADASTLISPQDHGVMAMIDRIAAGSNAAAMLLQQGFSRKLITFKPAEAEPEAEAGTGEATAEATTEAGTEEAVAEGGEEVATEAAVDTGLITLNASLDWIPVAGEVVMIGTGVYLAGDFLYHHWKPFHDIANDIGHGTVKVVKAIGSDVARHWDSFLNDWGL